MAACRGRKAPDDLHESGGAPKRNTLCDACMTARCRPSSTVYTCLHRSTEWAQRSREGRGIPLMVTRQAGDDHDSTRHLPERAVMLNKMPAGRSSNRQSRNVMLGTLLLGRFAGIRLAARTAAQTSQSFVHVYCPLLTNGGSASLAIERRRLRQPVSIHPVTFSDPVASVV